jgi:hypothetical protein
LRAVMLATTAGESTDLDQMVTEWKRPGFRAIPREIRVPAYGLE